MKKYVEMLRVTALLVVVSLIGPSVATLACEWACAPQPDVIVASEAAGGCHDHGDSAPDGPAVAAGHSCHDLADAPILVNPAPAHAAPAPLIVRLARSSLDDHAPPFHRPASIARLKPHDPPSLTIPLRI